MAPGSRAVPDLLIITGGLGQVYYINRLEDLVSFVVDVTGRAYAGESFISSQ